MPARWLLRASKDMLAQNLVTLASTIILLQWMETLPTQGIYKEAPLVTKLHTNYSCPFCHTDFINQEKVVEHMEICSGTDPELDVLKPISPYCQQTFDIYMTKLRITLEYKSWHTLESCLIFLNNFNNQEELIGHMNISPWTDLKLPTHRPVVLIASKLWEKITKLRTTFVFTTNGNKLYEICN